MPHFTFPSELIVVSSALNRPPIIETLWLNGEVVQCLPVFTEALLAERWTAQQEASRYGVVFSALNLRETIILLGHFNDSSISVAIDLEHGNVRPDWILTVSDAILCLAES